MQPLLNYYYLLEILYFEALSELDDAIDEEAFRRAYDITIGLYGTHGALFCKYYSIYYDYLDCMDYKRMEKEQC